MRKPIPLIEETIKEVDGISFYECFFCQEWVESPKTSKVMKKDNKIVGYHNCGALSCQKRQEIMEKGLEY